MATNTTTGPSGQAEAAGGLLPATAWLWGPYAGTAVLAGLGRTLGVTGAAGAAAVVAGVLLLPALVLAVAWRLGKPIAGVDQAATVGYLTGCSAAASAWTLAVTVLAWPAAAVLVAVLAAAAAAWAAYVPLVRSAVVTALAAGPTLGVVGALANPFAAGGPVRWTLAGAGGATAAAVPYWVTRRTRRRDQTESTVDVEPLLAALAKHLRHPVTMLAGSLAVAAAGRRWSIRIRLSDGQLVTDVQQVLPQIESELGLRPGAVMVAGERARRDEVAVTVAPVEPRAELEPAPVLPTSITQPAAVGRHDTGEVMYIEVYGPAGARHGLTGGETGFGKTRLFWALMRAWTATNDAVFVMIDLSGGATSAPWLPCLAAPPATTVEEGQAILAGLLAVATDRAALLPELGWESWQPSPEQPAVICAVDEGQKLLTNWADMNAYEQVIQVARKSGIVLWEMQPNPVQTEGISPTIREQSTYRLCMKSSGQAAKWLLADTPAAPVMFACTEFTLPGQVLGYGPGLAPIPGRGLDVDLAEARRTAVAHAARRPALDQLAAAALRRAGVPLYEPDSTDSAGGPADGSAGGSAAAAQAAAQSSAGGGSANGSVAGSAAGSVARPGPAHPDTTKAAHVIEQTLNDPAMMAALIARLNAPDVLGRPWAAGPPAPEIPSGRLETEQALRVLEVMLRQPGGTTPEALVEATRRSRSWVMDRLKQWCDDGVATRLDYGRYALALAEATR